MCQEFIWAEGKIPDALSKLHEFLLNPQSRVLCRSIPELSCNSKGPNQETNEDCSQNGVDSELGVRSPVPFKVDTWKRYHAWRQESKKNINVNAPLGPGSTLDTK